MRYSYTVYHLFVDGGSSEGTTTVDVVVRTSLAAVFGYFLSGNFGKMDPQTPEETALSLPVLTVPDPGPQKGDSGLLVKKQLGFQAPVSDSKGEEGKITVSNGSSIGAKGCNTFQVTVVAVVGIVSLCVLMGTRWFPEFTPEITAIVSQLRDFVAASIGFLASCKKTAAG